MGLIASGASKPDGAPRMLMAVRGVNTIKLLGKVSLENWRRRR